MTDAPKTVLISGASGFVGSALCRLLSSEGYRVRPLARPGSDAADGVPWIPLAEADAVDPAALEGAEALVHLAGESIAGGRWNEARKRRLYDSRVVSTRGLVRALVTLGDAAPRLVCASAVGFYGDCGDDVRTEQDPSGDDFLARLCVDWEHAADPAREAGITVSHARLGLILGKGGGALKALWPLFKAGLGGRVGDGRQWMSWVSLHDTVRALCAAIVDPELKGPFNVTAPNPVTNAELTRQLAAALKRPALLPVPGFAARLALGEMADITLLGGVKALPQVLLGRGFAFRHADLTTCLQELASDAP